LKAAEERLKATLESDEKKRCAVRVCGHFSTKNEKSTGILEGNGNVFGQTGYLYRDLAGFKAVPM